jgi:hypothetical protein
MPQPYWSYNIPLAEKATESTGIQIEQKEERLAAHIFQESRSRTPIAIPTRHSLRPFSAKGKSKQARTLNTRNNRMSQARELPAGTLSYVSETPECGLSLRG